MSGWTIGILSFLGMIVITYIMSKVERKRFVKNLNELYEEFPEDRALAYQLMTRKDMQVWTARDLLQQHRRSVEKEQEATKREKYEKEELLKEIETLKSIQEIDRATASKATGDLLRLRQDYREVVDQHYNLCSDLEDWYEQNRGGETPEAREHLEYLFYKHNLERRKP